MGHLELDPSPPKQHQSDNDELEGFSMPQMVINRLGKGGALNDFPESIVPPTCLQIERADDDGYPALAFVSPPIVERDLKVRLIVRAVRSRASDPRAKFRDPSGGKSSTSTMGNIRASARAPLRP